MHSEDTRWFFSFLNICETLGVEANRLRAALARLASETSTVDDPPPELFPHLRSRRRPG